jgi:lipopolysaccharide export system permease protein
MRILTRYVLKAHIAPALAGLALFYFVLSMDFIVDYLNLFLTKGVPGIAVLEAFLLSLAWMTVLAVPMAVMVAVLTAFGRLSGDNEITASKANGVNVWSLVFPVMVAAAVATAALFYFGNHVLPAANFRLKTLLVDIHRVRPLATIEPGILTELPGGYTIVVDQLDPRTSEIFQVRIHKIEGGEPLQTIVARRGVISSSQTENVLRMELFDGEIHEIDPEDATRYNRLLFDRHVINLDAGMGAFVRGEGARRGDREMSMKELQEDIARHTVEIGASREKQKEAAQGFVGALLDLADGTGSLPDGATVGSERERVTREIVSEARQVRGALKRTRQLNVEYHKKFSIPFSCIVFVLLGAPLGIRSRRGGVGMGAGIGILFFLVYYLFLIGGEQLGDRGLVSPPLAMWAPNVLFGGLGLFLTLATCREWRVQPLTRVLDFLLRVPTRPAETEEAA